MPSVALITDAAKRLLLGRPFRSERLSETLLPKRIALPVFASDALSSVAYAPDEIFLTLALAGAGAYLYSPWVGLCVVFVMVIVVLSYRQNVHAYPSGGGDYEVATTNLGVPAGLTVASALLVDYVLTVAVSVSSGAQYAASAIPMLRGHEALVAVAVVAVLTSINLRGVRESGTAFAVPTYAFMAAMIGMGLYGFYRMARGSLPLVESAELTLLPRPQFEEGLIGLGWGFLLLRAFSSGCAALTGVEAISNGVPAFQRPKSKNAATTLAMLGAIAVTMLMSVIVLAQHMSIRYSEEPATHLLRDGVPVGEDYVQRPVIGQIATALFSHAPVIFYLITATTGLILVLAANTAFNGFPVLGSILAQDGLAPRLAGVARRPAGLQQRHRLPGVRHVDRLLILGLRRRDHQADPALHRRRLHLLHREPDRHGAALDPAAAHRERSGGPTADAALAGGQRHRPDHHRQRAGDRADHQVRARRLPGPDRDEPALPADAGIRRHYQSVRKELAIDANGTARQLPSRVHAIVLVSKIHKPTMRALAYARASRPSVLEAITVVVDPEDTMHLQRDWDARDIPVPLRALDSPYREITRPVVDYVKGIRRDSPRDLVVVYVPEYVVGHWWEHVLHNQSALRLKTRLHYTPGVMVASVPWQLSSSEGLEERAAAKPIVGRRARRIEDLLDE